MISACGTVTVARVEWTTNASVGAVNVADENQAATLIIVPSDKRNAATQRELRGLWLDAFGDRLIGHASAVPRRIKFGVQRWRTVGYVEAGATHPDYQGQCVGRRVMGGLHAEIAVLWPVALLSTGHAIAFYVALGWEQWRGVSYTATASAVVLEGEHGGLMVLRIDRSLVPDLSTTVTCEDRAGDAW